MTNLGAGLALMCRVARSLPPSCHKNEEDHALASAATMVLKRSRLSPSLKASGRDKKQWD